MNIKTNSFGLIVLYLYILGISASATAFELSVKVSGSSLDNFQVGQFQIGSRIPEELEQYITRNEYAPFPTKCPSSDVDRSKTSDGNWFQVSNHLHQFSIGGTLSDDNPLKDKFKSYKYYAFEMRIPGSDGILRAFFDKKTLLVKGMILVKPIPASFSPSEYRDAIFKEFGSPIQNNVLEKFTDKGHLRAAAYTYLPTKSYITSVPTEQAELYPVSKSAPKTKQFIVLFEGRDVTFYALDAEDFHVIRDYNIKICDLEVERILASEYKGL
ncbi:hypothetical protein AB4403_18360 [Vibrio breoganii]